MNFWTALRTSLLISFGYLLGTLPIASHVHDSLLAVSHKATSLLEGGIEKNSIKAAILPKTSDLDIQQISQYDSIIKEISAENLIDWRLISSIVFVESSFKSKATSNKGAQGLMQIMPVVAKEYGLKNAYHPETNIAAGVKHLIRWYKSIKGATSEDRMMLALAAFNGGPGHVKDAQALAFRLKKNPLKWNDVKQVLPLLEHKLYNWDASTGFCQGNDMVVYVERIMSKYQKYQKDFPSDIAVMLVEKTKNIKAG